MGPGLRRDDTFGEAPHSRKTLRRRPGESL